MVLDGQLDISPYEDFTSAAQAVLKFLSTRFDFDLWMVTRTEGEDWIVLQTEDHGYQVEKGQVFRWTDSFCSLMVQGLGPRIAPSSKEVPVYAMAPIGRAVPISAYIGVPLLRKNGQLFGTLCAIDPDPQPESIQNELPLIEIMAKLLASILELEIRAAEEIRKKERAQFEAFSDGLTGLYNRRGWDSFLSAEEHRCRLFGHSAAIIVVDLDGLKKLNDTLGHSAGDELIVRAAKILLETVRRQDIVARIGGDEFTVLAVECDNFCIQALANRIQDNFSYHKINMSLGFALRNHSSDLKEAWKEADTKMYECKKIHKCQEVL